MIRCQLPAYSPLSPGKLIRAALHAVHDPEQSREDLAAMLEARFDAPASMLTSSGTHALQTALVLATQVRPWADRPVALPAYTCYDVATAAVGAGVAVTFYDIDPDSLCPDPDGVRRALARGAGVLVANSLYGFPLDWASLRRECESAGTLLIEDAAQGVGSGWADGEGGTFGDLTVLSFGRGKGWTGGGGGALLLRSKFLEEPGSGRARSSMVLRPSGPSADLRALGVSLTQWAVGRPWLYGLPSSLPALGLGETHYKAPTAPASMAPFPAAATVSHAESARAETGARRAGAAEWQTLLASLRSLREYRLPHPVEGGVCGWLRFPLIAPDGDVKEDLLRVGRAAGLSGGYPTPLPGLAALSDLHDASDRGQAPGASELASRLLTLPTHSRTTARDRRKIADLL